MRLKGAMCEAGRTRVIDSWGFVRDLEQYEELKSLKAVERTDRIEYEELLTNKEYKVKTEKVMYSLPKAVDNKKRKPCKFRRRELRQRNRFEHMEVPDEEIFG